MQYGEKSESAIQYVDDLGERLKRHFDIQFKITKEGEYADLYAFHQQNFHKSFITRATVYEGFSVYEHMLIRIVPACTEELLTEFQNMLVRITPLLAKPNKFHKRSVVTGVLVSEQSVSTELGKKTSSFFHRQSYKFCFYGWSETQCVIVSLADKNVYVPKRSKDMGKLFSF